MIARNRIQFPFLVALATAIGCSSEEPDSSVAALTEAGAMTPEAGIAAGGGGSVGVGGTGALGADSATQDAAIPAVPPPECIPPCLWEVLSSCIDPGATAVEPDSGGCVRDADHWLEEPRALVCDADDQFYFVTPSTGVVDLIAWPGSCYVGGRLVYTKRPRYGGSAFNGSVLFEDAEGRILVEVFDPYSLGTGPTVYCGGMDAEGAGEVMLLGEALDSTKHVIPDHPCAPWLSLVSLPANDYYWPGCTPGDCPDPPSVPMDASLEGGRVETDAASDGAGLATDAAGSL